MTIPSRAVLVGLGLDQSEGVLDGEVRMSCVTAPEPSMRGSELGLDEVLQMTCGEKISDH